MRTAKGTGGDCVDPLLGGTDTSCGVLLLKEWKLSRSSRRMLGQGAESVGSEWEMPSAGGNASVKRGVDADGIYRELPDCYPMSRKDIRRKRRKPLGIVLRFHFVSRFQCRYVVFSELHS